MQLHPAFVTTLIAENERAMRKRAQQHRSAPSGRAAPAARPGSLIRGAQPGALASSSTASAAPRPLSAITEPPGWVAAPHM